MKKSVLVYLTKNQQVCLGLKKRNYSQGKWNGFGGKLESGESPKTAAIREVFEEAGIKIQSPDLIKRAEFYYHEPPEDWMVTVFTCSQWSRNIIESDEMKPQWFNIERLPLSHMWPNDTLWIKKLLTTTKKFQGVFWHDQNGQVLKYELKER